MLANHNSRVCASFCISRQMLADKLAVFAAAAFAAQAAQERQSARDKTNEPRWDCVETELGRVPLSTHSVGHPFVIERERSKQVYVDGQYGPAYDSAWGLRFSGDGARDAYLAKQRTDW